MLILAAVLVAGILVLAAYGVVCWRLIYGVP
jgi:hypothetical protein